jgi:hypothetical protein
MKYGFVYIWRDRGKDRYYIGAHWGTEVDGYKCSSNWMRKSFQRRPEDFRRRILFRTNNYDELWAKELEWIRLIPELELGKIYYNLKFNGPPQSNGKRLSHSEIMKAKYASGELIAYRKGKPSTRKGVRLSEETKGRMSKSAIGKKKSPLTAEHKEKLRLTQLGKSKSKEAIAKAWETRRRNATTFDPP